jgi:hypothetical protein
MDYYLLSTRTKMPFNLFSYLWASVLTPYYKEDVLYSADELNKENEDGISTLFYLQKIYPGEFKFHCCICFSLYEIAINLQLPSMVTN